MITPNKADVMQGTKKHSLRSYLDHPIRFMTTPLRALGILRLARLAIGQPWFARIAGLLIANRIQLLHDTKDSDAINVLAYSAVRFKQDLETLAQSPKMRIYSIEPTDIQLLNTIFKVDGKRENTVYTLENDPEILEQRKALRSFATIVMGVIKRRLSLDCAITPNIHYRMEQEWAGACVDAGLTFVALHKEFTVLDDRHLGWRVDSYHKEKSVFNGSYIFVTNELAHSLAQFQFRRAGNGLTVCISECIGRMSDVKKSVRA